MGRFGNIGIVLVAAAAFLSACAPPLTPAQQQATAEVAGCWPYGYEQPEATPTVELPTPRAGTPLPTLRPTQIIYPTCTPAPHTPTVTPRPTRTPTPIPPSTPIPPASVGGPVEMGHQSGYVALATMAVHPANHTAAVAWFTNGSSFDDSKDGQVWVKVQRADKSWSDAQTANTETIGKAGYAGLGLTIGYDGAVYVVYGMGRGGDRRIFLVESHDAGSTWSQPEQIEGVDADAAPPDMQPSAESEPTATPAPGTPEADPAWTPTPDVDGGGGASAENTSPSGDGQTGAVIALRADAAGGLHLLFRVRSVGGKTIAYAYRAPGQRVWQLSEPFRGQFHYRGALGLLTQPDGRIKRFVAIQTDNAITVYDSLDGLSWNRASLPVGQYLNPETIFTMTMVVAPRGPGLIAVTWGQYARGGVFAAVSLDGGASWGEEERIAQHNRDGRAFENQGEGVMRSGFDPWVVYDAISGHLVVSWTEMDVIKSPRTKTTMYAVRDLAETTVPVWRHGISPATVEQERPPTLGPIGWYSRLFGSADGRAHWLLGINVLNRQSGVFVQPITLPALAQDSIS